MKCIKCASEGAVVLRINQDTTNVTMYCNTCHKEYEIPFATFARITGQDIHALLDEFGLTTNEQHLLALGYEIDRNEIPYLLNIKLCSYCKYTEGHTKIDATKLQCEGIFCDDAIAKWLESDYDEAF